MTRSNKAFPSISHKQSQSDKGRHIPGLLYGLLYGLLSLTIVVLFVLDLYSGTATISMNELLHTLLGTGNGNTLHENILLQFRLPRALTALLAGAALSLCGLQMQTLFRNPLADPYILGISSGSGLGVGFFLMGLSAWGIHSLPGWMDGASAILPAWAGAFLFTALILWASARLKDNLSLLIFGVMLGSVGSAIISLLQYISKAEALKNYVLWSMGSFSGTDLQQVGILAGLCLVGILLSFSNIKNLNVLYSGEQYAISLGLSPRRMRRRILLAVAILAGSTTAFCGPIGFVGIAVPHIARILLRDADHRRLMPATLLCGCAIMLLADCIAQLPGSTGIIPINTVTALLGIPVILMIILKQPE